MKTLWITRIVLITSLIIPIPLFSQQGNRVGRIDRRSREFFKSLYKSPFIEPFNGSHKKVFPSLKFYSVFEEEHLVEDPLVADIWIRTSKGTFFISNDMTEALKEEAIVPHDAGEALAIVRELLLVQYDGCFVVEGAKSFSGEIPVMYNDKVFFPVVKKIPRGYSVTINLYFPDSRYAEFFSVYQNKLVGYNVTILGSTYCVQQECVYSHGENPAEIKLIEAVIKHIESRELIKDLDLFLQKRSLYGVTDPSDRSQVKQRIVELSALWDGAFVKKHGELHSLVREVLKNNPDFRFDSNYLYQKTKEMRSVSGIEYYLRTLEILLQEIVERTRY